MAKIRKICVTYDKKRVNKVNTASTRVILNHIITRS